MVLKFHVQYDNATGLQKDKIQPGQESKMTAEAKHN